MELKRLSRIGLLFILVCLNRTFYGIETVSSRSRSLILRSLNRTIKTDQYPKCRLTEPGFNSIKGTIKTRYLLPKKLSSV